MDSEHKHELKQNDLEYALTHLGEFWDKNGKSILTVLIILAIGFGGYNWYKLSRYNAHNNQWSDLADARNPNAYNTIATSTKDDAVRNIALLRGADLLVAMAATGGESTDDNLAEAAANYQTIIDDKSAHAAFKLNAQLGLAAMAEQTKQFDKAATIYATIQTNAGDQYPGIAAQANARAQFLHRLDSPVVFAPEVEVTEEQTPADEAKPADESKPADQAKPEAQ